MSKRSAMLDMLDVLEEEHVNGEGSSLSMIMYQPACADAMIAFDADDYTYYLLEDESFVKLDATDFFEMLREQIKNASNKQVNDYYKWWEAGTNV